MIFIFKCKYNLHLQRFSYLLLKLGIAKLCLIFFILFLNAAAVLAAANQDKILKGKVVDSKGLAIPGANVVIDGTMRGVSTQIDGTFVLPVTDDTGFIRVTSVGFMPRRVEYNVIQELIIQLEDEISQLDEVRVIAYGTQAKRESVGAQSSIKADDLKDIPSPSVANLLQGKVAGINVVNMSGSPGGSGTALVIRGFNSLSSENGRMYSEPTIVIDGVIINAGMSQETGLDRLADIDPNDIEDIQIMKDASSASIYGSQAANGIIIITTKKGRINQKPKLSASYTQSFAMKSSLPDMTGGNRERALRFEALKNYQTTYYDAELGTYVYAQDFWDAYKNNAHYSYFWNMGNGADIALLQDSLNTFYNNSTNLFDYYFRTAKVSDVNLQISGGAENVAYFIGLGYYNEKGVLRNTGFNRMKVLTNLYINPYKNVESNIRFYLARTSRDRSGKGKDRFSYAYDDYLERIPSELMTTSTLLPGPDSAAFDAMIESYENTIEENESYRFRGSYDLSYEFIQGLKLKSSISADYSQSNQHLFLPSSLDSDGDTYSSGQIGRNLIWMNENLLTYRKEYHDHTFDALLGLSMQAEIKNNLSGFGRRAASDLIEYVTWSGNSYDSDLRKNLKDFMSDYTKSTMMSYFARLNYNYKRKYLASLTLRRDGSSKFGEDNKWATFPAIGMGYAFSEEPFMDGIKDYLNFNYGKFRFSWGKSGKNFESPYLAFGVLEQSSNTFLGNPIIQPEWFYGLINRELSWEETSQYDVGLDLDFFDYRLGIVIDYYNRYTDKLLYRVPLSGNYNGYENQWQNAYAISNSGIEVKVDYKIINRENFTWDVTVNYCRNWNMLKKSTSGMDLQNTRLVNNLSIIGKPINGIYVLKNNGYYSSQDEVPYYYDGNRRTYQGNYNSFYRPGDRKFTDIDGNGRINVLLPQEDDRVYAGSPLPKGQGGMTHNLKWKSFDLNIHFNAMFGRHILNAGAGGSVGTIISANPSDMLKPIFVNLDDVTFWQKAGDNSDYPINRAEDALHNFATNLSSNVQKVSFLKLKSLSLGYTLPKETLGFTARVFVSAENIATFTNYKGSDPETVDIVTGIDYGNNYPLATKITLGVKFDF